MERLKVLLAHWIEHNEEHAKEFMEWAERAKEEGIDPAICEGIARAARQMEGANSSLREALERLQGEAR